MEKHPGQVREEIETTREALSEKLELLEGRARDTIEHTKDRVKQTFELNYHMEQRPWTMLGMAVACGYFLGHLSTLQEKARERTALYSGPLPFFSPPIRSEAPNTPREKEPDEFKKRTGNRAWVLEEFHGEIALIKGAALGAVSSLVRDMVKQAVPHLTAALNLQGNKGNLPPASPSSSPRNGKAGPQQSPADYPKNYAS
ncbi:MAG: hypothetical protein AB7P69_22130 [Candidatus Binatia bacterium]